MATEINFPKPGMGTDEGTLVAWHKKVGDSVAQGELIAEIETAKSTLEIEAPVSGTLTQILVQEDETIPVNSTLGIIE